MSEEKQKRVCELAWLEPWQDERGSLVLGSAEGHTSERSLRVDTAEDLLAELRRISTRIHTWCDYWVAVSLEGLEEPDLYATAVGDCWHFWYLADGGSVSLRSVGNEAATGTNLVIFSEFDEVPERELVPGLEGEQVVREWLERRQLSDVIRWRTFE